MHILKKKSLFKKKWPSITKKSEIIRPKTYFKRLRQSAGGLRSATGSSSTSSGRTSTPSSSRSSSGSSTTGWRAKIWTHTRSRHHQLQMWIFSRFVLRKPKTSYRFSGWAPLCGLTTKKIPFFDLPQQNLFSIHVFVKGL